MPKIRNLSHTHVNNSQSLKGLPTSQQAADEKVRPSLPRYSQLTVYDVITLLAFLAGITLPNLSLIFLSCFMAIASGEVPQ